jgi:hypothetical protein
LENVSGRELSQGRGELPSEKLQQIYTMLAREAIDSQRAFE